MLCERLPTKYKKCFLPPRVFSVELETSEKKDTPKGWEDTEDGSISGLEYLSGPILGKNGVDKIRKGCMSLSTPTETVNRDCGYHLHINARDCSESQIATFVRFAKRYEKYFFLLVDKHRRDNSFCESLSDELKNLKEPHKYLVDYTGDYYDSDDKYDDTRYMWVNFHSYYYRGTIEIRLHQGTTLYGNVINWIELWLKVFEWAINPNNWEGKNVTFWGLLRKAKIRRKVINFYKDIYKANGGVITQRREYAHS